MENKNQLSLLAFGDMDETTRSIVFKCGEKTEEGKPQNILNQTMGLAKRKDIAEALNLKGDINKDKLDAAILKSRDELKGQIAQLLTRLNGDPNWTGTGIRVNKGKKTGMLSVALRLSQVTRFTGPTDEQIAKTLGITVEEVAKMRERQLAKLGTVDVESTILADDPHADEEMPDQKAARELAEEPAALTAAQ